MQMWRTQHRGMAGWRSDRSVWGALAGRGGDVGRGLSDQSSERGPFAVGFVWCGDGDRFAERIMTVAATCRQQKRNVLEFLVQAIDADLRNKPAPSLLPR
nr:Transposase, fragment [uncultured bacterium]